MGEGTDKSDWNRCYQGVSASTQDLTNLIGQIQAKVVRVRADRIKDLPPAKEDASSPAQAAKYLLVLTSLPKSASDA